jgi:hypothetical protein
MDLRLWLLDKLHFAISSIKMNKVDKNNAKKKK